MHNIVVYNAEITSIPHENADGLHIDNNEFGDIKNVKINLEDCFEYADESFSVVNGGEAIVSDCEIGGVGKVCLIGSGDQRADGCTVIFNNCVFQNGCRRFPEVQDGYDVTLNNCTIKNWGLKKFWTIRAFGAWVHENSTLTLNNCRFEQESFFQTGFINFFKDLAYHIGQAFNDEGIRGLFRLNTWIPGVCKGAFATTGGKLVLNNCTKNKWWIYLENSK